MRDIQRNGSLGDVVNRASKWVKDKKVLLVYDDLWPAKEDKFRYVNELIRVLLNAPESRVLVSTRDCKIAEAVSKLSVSFQVLEPNGEKSCKIVRKAAFGEDWNRALGTTGRFLDQILKVCAGLPLALALAGRSIGSDVDTGKSPELAVEDYSYRLERNGVKQLEIEEIAEYHSAGLKYVVQASLDACHEWGESEAPKYDMRHFFKSLCVLEKQQTIPECALQRYWNLEEVQVDKVVKKFVNLSVVKRELSARSGSGGGSEKAAQQFCVRLHDLVLDLCRQMAADELVAHHLRMVQAYSSILQQLPPDEWSEQQYYPWWSLPHDGYAYENINRHLVHGGACLQLESLLCDCRWSVCRMDRGGWPALNQHFQRLFSSSSRTHYAAMHNLLQVLTRSWHVVSCHRSLFAFNVFAHLSPRERNAECVASYLASVKKYYPVPWLHPLSKCFPPTDGRERSTWNMPSIVESVCVSWSTQRVYITSGNDIHVWCIKSQQQLFVMEGHTSVVNSMAISSDGKRIVSGSSDNTVRRWDADTGLLVGDVMEGREGWDVLEESMRAQAGSEQNVFRENGIDVLLSGTTCRITTSDGGKIVLGLHNGCAVVCEVRLPT